MQSCTQLVTHDDKRPDENKMGDKKLPAAATLTLITSIRVGSTTGGNLLG